MTPFFIALARRQYSGNAKGVINGIGVVNDYRVYDPQTDGKSKLDHSRSITSTFWHDG